MSGRGRPFVWTAGLLMLVCGGCTTLRKVRENGVRERSDSLVRSVSIRTVSLERRHAAGNGTERVREVLFSPPDSLGRQYPERVKLTERVWKQADSMQVEREQVQTDTLRTERREKMLLIRQQGASRPTAGKWLRGVTCIAVFLLVAGGCLYIRLRFRKNRYLRSRF